MKLGIFKVFALLLLASCVSSRLADREAAAVESCEKDWTAAHVEPDGSKVVLCLGEDLNQALVRRLSFQLGSANPRAEVLLVVDTSGGDVSSAIKIANLLIERDLTILISGKCFSSCANYLFFAADRKIVAHNAELGWHGGLVRNREEFAAAFPRKSYEKLNPSVLERESEYEDWLDRHWSSYKEDLEQQNALLSRFPYAEKVIYGGVIALECSEAPRNRVSAWRPAAADFASRFSIDGVEFLDEADGRRSVIIQHDAEAGGNYKKWFVDKKCLYSRLFPYVQEQ